MVGLSGGETGVTVGFSTRWLSSDGGQSEKFRILLGCGCCYVIHGEYWHFHLWPSAVSGEISMGSCHDLEKFDSRG